MQLNTNPLVEDASVEKLQDCLRSELSAMQTYQLALTSVSHVGLHHALQEIFVSHSRRSEQLSLRIKRLGGEVPTGAGVRGAIAAAVQAGADRVSDRAAIGMLEEGETRALRLYRLSVGGTDDSARWLVEAALLPEQERTHALCHTLKTYVDAPS